MENNHYVVAVAGFFINEGVTKLVRQLDRVSRRCVFYKDATEDFRQNVHTLFLIIETIKYSDVEFPEKRQDGVELTNKLLASKECHLNHNLRLAKQMKKIHRDISRFIQLLPVSYDELVQKDQDQD